MAFRNKKRQNPNVSWDDFQPTDIDSSLFPETGKFSDFIYTYMRGKLGGDDNANITEKGRHDDRLKIMGELVDHTDSRPEILSGLLFLYMNGQKNIVTTKLFPVKESMSTHVVQNNIVMDLELIEPGVRGVPGRLMQSRTSRREKHSTYFIKGFMLDYHIMKTSTGVQQWDLFVAGLTQELWNTLTMQCVELFGTQAHHYTHPSLLYPNNAVPLRVRDAFAYMASMFCIIGTDHLAMPKLAAHATTILGNGQKTFSGFVVQPADLYHIKFANEANFFHVTTGPDGVRNRRLASNLSIQGGYEVDVIPLIAASEHTSASTQTFQNVVQLGSKVEFPEYGHLGKAEDYLSHNRTIGFASWTDDGFRDHSFINFLGSCFEFTPEHVSRSEMANPRAGKLNLGLLRHMATNSTKLMADSHTKYDPRRVNQFLAYNESTKSIYPIAVLGERSIEHCAPDGLDFSAATLCNVLFADTTHEERNVIREGMKLAGLLSSTTGGFDFAGAFGRNAAVVRATADPSDAARAPDGPDSPGSLGVNMTKPNEFGFVSYSPDYNFGTVGGGIPYGFGSISGFLTIASRAASGSNIGINKEMEALIVKFCALYSRAIGNMVRCFPEHPAVAPTLVPIFNKSENMDQLTKSMIVAWYTIFADYLPPVLVGLTSGDVRATVDESDASTSTKTPLSKLPADLVARLTAGLGGDFGDAAKLGEIAKNLDAVAAAYRATMVGTTKRPVNLAGDVVQQSFRDIETRISPLTIPAGTSDEDKQAFAKYVADNLAGLKMAMEAICKKANTSGVTGYSIAEIGKEYIALNTGKLDATTSGTPGARATTSSGSDKVVMQLNFTAAALKGNASATHAQFKPIADHDNPVTHTRYVVDGSVGTGFKCGSAFEDEDKNTFGRSLFTSLFTVHPLYPATPRSGSIGHAAAARNLGSLVSVHNVRTARFRDGYPATPNRDAHAAGVYADYSKKIYGTDGVFFDRLSNAFPMLPEFAVQTIANPVTGSPDRNTLTDFEAKWMRSHQLDTLQGACVRAMMLMPVDMQTMRAMYACNVAIPLGGAYWRPNEAQMTNDIVAKAEGPVGTAFMSPIDSITSFEANPQKHQTMAFYHAVPVTDDPRNYVVLPSVRAGMGLGGKGNKPINEGLDLWAKNTDAARARLSAVGNGAALGDHSLIPVLLNNNEARDPFKHNDVDIAGWWNPVAFAHIMHKSRDFNEQPIPMMSGQYAPIVVLGLTGEKEIPDGAEIKDLSPRQIAIIRENNTWCHQITQQYRNEKGEVVLSGSSHPHGPTKPGVPIVAKEQGMGSIKAADALGF